MHNNRQRSISVVYNRKSSKTLTETESETGELKKQLGLDKKPLHFNNLIKQTL